MVKSFLKVKDVAAQLKVATDTVRKYCNEGRLQYDLNPAGQRVFQQSYVDSFLGVDNTRAEQIVVFYVRASDGDVKKMDTQVALLADSYGEPVRVYSDKASGLNSKRKGLARLLDDAAKNKFNTIAITQQDRLTRFGYEYIERYLTTCGVSVVVLGEDSSKTLHEELLQDFMSLVASFSGKFYRLRGYQQQKQLLQKVGEVIETKQSI